MSSNITNEFSFILKPSQHGIGVFAAQDIKKGTFLRLFATDEHPEESRILNKKDVPELFRSYCIDKGDKLACPEDFGWMKIGWYLNHSKTPNAKYENWECFATRDILAGEEILIDYNTLEEPKEAKEDYY